MIRHQHAPKGKGRPRAKARSCGRCGEDSRPGNRVGQSRVCRLCTEEIPRKVRPMVEEQLTNGTGA